MVEVRLMKANPVLFPTLMPKRSFHRYYPSILKMPQYHNLTGTAQPSALPFLPRSLCVLSDEWRDVILPCTSLSQSTLLGTFMTGRGTPNPANTSWVYGDE
ncbi:hypothetical protein ACET6J_15525 [Aeromonas veronii]|uniref:hypothetical protein n=1 Tax=Aeromonas veronii TaxID=654 RepID=UPI0038E50CBC